MARPGPPGQPPQPPPATQINPPQAGALGRVLLRGCRGQSPAYPRPVLIG
jgi:hypothetical protein